MKQKSKYVAICLAAGLWSWPAGATTITSLNTGYTWTGEINSGSEVDPALPTGSPWTTGGFTFTNPNGNVSIMPNVGSGSSGLTTNHGEIDIAAPAGGETAILLNLGVWDGSSTLLHGNTLNINLSDGETFSSVPYGIFWFSSSTPITSVTVLSSTSGDDPFIHGLAYGVSSIPPDGPSGSPAPEAATILLASSGALILFGTRRRWLRREA
jgi:hypothetical protein